MAIKDKLIDPLHENTNIISESESDDDNYGYYYGEDIIEMICGYTEDNDTTITEEEYKYYYESD